jgi:hypothetical protein
MKVFIPFNVRRRCFVLLGLGGGAEALSLAFLRDLREPDQVRTAALPAQAQHILRICYKNEN